MIILQRSLQRITHEFSLLFSSFNDVSNSYVFRLIITDIVGIQSTDWTSSLERFITSGYDFRARGISFDCSSRCCCRRLFARKAETAFCKISLFIRESWTVFRSIIGLHRRSHWSSLHRSTFMNTDVLSCRNYSHFPYSPGIVRKKKFLLLLNDNAITIINQ